ncbi:dopaminechrome tautomerase [Onthophagus taurus]|uniref:dopaminechrome tautomerase n=1 Tax=Onthophagus taurus TaxID=166361 RepID=UPI0039BE948D
MWLTPIAIITLLTSFGACQDFEVINQWNLLDYEFPNYEFASKYRPENSVFTGLEVTEDRIFLATPRLRAGVAATLATIPRRTPPGSSPVLKAYPDWSFHSAGNDNNNCSGLISVYRIRRDSCNRLWVLDSGIMTSIDDFTRVCTPKLLIFNLRTDVVERQVIFPREVIRPSSLFTNLIIDESVQGSCDNAVVYISDTAAPGIIVYDSLKDQAWRFIHPTMFPDPDHSDIEIDSERFSLMDGIVGLAHSPNLRLMYYQPLATDRVFTISTDVLRKGPLAEGEELPVRLAGRKSSQGLGLTVDPRDDSLFFSPLTETSVTSWNPITNQQRLLAFDRKRLQFPAELRWMNHDPDSVWALTTRFQRFFKRTVKNNEVNLRIVRFPLNSVPTFPVSNSVFFK